MLLLFYYRVKKCLQTNEYFMFHDMIYVYVKTYNFIKYHRLNEVLIYNILLTVLLLQC